MNLKRLPYISLLLVTALAACQKEDAPVPKEINFANLQGKANNMYYQITGDTQYVNRSIGAVFVKDSVPGDSLELRVAPQKIDSSYTPIRFNLKETFLYFIQKRTSYERKRES